MSDLWKELDVVKSAWMAGVVAAIVGAAGMTVGAWGQELSPVREQASVDPTRPTLRVGDKAPELEIGVWVKGEPLERFEAGTAYVVEFWATWCEPCLRSVPHLTELQKKHAGDKIEIIGVSSEDPRETLSKVRDFVHQMGEKMEYRVGFDAGERTREAYMVAARQRSIPTAFVVSRDGRIAWIGHPMELDPVLEAVAAGTWDVEAKAKELREAEEIEARVLPIRREVARAIRNLDHEAALKGIDQMEEIDPKNASRYANQRFNVLYTIKADFPAAYAMAEEAMAGVWKDDAMALSGVAWGIMEAQGVPDEKRDMSVALKLATRANEVRGGKDPIVLDTLARVHKRMGNMDEAIAVQEKAVETATDERQKQQLTARLEEYRALKK